MTIISLPGQTSTYTILASSNPIVFDSATDISVTSGDAVYGAAGTFWSVMNLGKIAVTGGSGAGVVLQAGGVVINAGSIGNASGYGVVLNAGGVVDNLHGAAISVSGINQIGVVTNDQTATVINAGTVNSAYGSALYLQDGGVVSNAAGGEIIGGQYGIEVNGNTGAVTNAGMIQGATKGVSLDGSGAANQAGTVNNATSGVIDGAFGVFVSNETGAVTNAGTITGNDLGVYLRGGGTNEAGTVNNAASGVIGGAVGVNVNFETGLVTNAGTITGNFGVYLGGGGTVTNSGVISGKTDSILFGGGGQNTVVLETGSTLTGAAVGSTTIGATNALILQGSGTANNVFDNFNTLYVGAKAAWTLSASSTIGQTTIDGGSLDVTGGLTTAITLENNGSAQFAHVTNDNVDFSGSSAGALTLGASDSGTVTGFGVGDEIIFNSATYSASDMVSVVASGADEAVTITEGATTISSFTVVGDYTPVNFTLGAAKGGGLAVGYNQTVTVAQYLAQQTALDKKANGFTISDSGADIEKLTAKELSGKTSAGPVTLYDSGGDAILAGSQTAALTADDFFVTVAAGATVTEDFTNGGYDVIGSLPGTNYAYEDIFAAPAGTAKTATLCAQSVDAPNGDNLFLFGDSLTMSSSSAGLSVTSGADVSPIVPLTASSSTTIWANGENAETFKFASGFGNCDIEGFLVAGTKTAPADTLDLDTKMFKGLTSTTATTDLAALIKGNDLTFSDGVVTLTDAAHDTLTLSGISTLAAFEKDIKFFTK